MMTSGKIVDIVVLKDILLPIDWILQVDAHVSVQETDRSCLRGLVFDWITNSTEHRGKIIDLDSNLSTNISSCQVLWWNADSGCGKTYVAFQLAAELHSKKMLFAFAYISNSTSSNPKLFVKSIAYQMVKVFPSLLHQVFEAASRSDSTASIPQLFDLLILEPLKSIHHDDTPNGAKVIVLDGLDEMLLERMEEVELLKCLLTKLPLWIKIFLTSQSTPHVLKYINNVPKYSIDAQNPAIQTDLRTFVEKTMSQRLVALGNTNPDLLSRATTRILEKCEGKYAYVCVIGQLLEHLVQVEGAAEAVVEVALRSLPTGIYRLYDIYFQHIEDAYPMYFEECFEIIKLMCVCRIPLSVKMLRQMYPEFGELLVLHFHQFFHVFFPLHQQVFRVAHGSILDWLRSKEKGDKYFIEESEAHRLLVVRSFTAVTQVKYDTKLNTLNVPALARQFFDSLNERSSEVSAYLFKYLLVHLCGIGAVVHDLISQFLMSFYWLLGSIKVNGLITVANDVQLHASRMVNSTEFGIYSECWKDILGCIHNESKQQSLDMINENVATKLLTCLKRLDSTSSRLMFQSLLLEINDWLDRKGYYKPLFDWNSIRPLQQKMDTKLLHKHNIVYLLALNNDQLAVLTEKSQSKHHKKHVPKKMEIDIWNYSQQDCVETIEYNEPYCESFLFPSYLFQVVGKEKRKLKFARNLPQILKESLKENNILLNMTRERYFIAGNSSLVSIWDISDCFHSKKLPFQYDNICDITTTPNGRVCIGLHNKLVLWDFENEKSLQELYLGDGFLTKELQYNPVQDEFYISHTYCNVHKKKNATERRIKVIGYTISSDLLKVKKHELNDPTGYYFEDFDASTNDLFFVNGHLLFYVDHYSTHFTCYDTAKQKVFPTVVCPSYQCTRLLYKDQTPQIVVADKRTVEIKAVDTLKINHNEASLQLTVTAHSLNYITTKFGNIHTLWNIRNNTSMKLPVSTVFSILNDGTILCAKENASSLNDIQIYDPEIKSMKHLHGVNVFDSELFQQTVIEFGYRNLLFLKSAGIWTLAKNYKQNGLIECIDKVIDARRFFSCPKNKLLIGFMADQSIGVFDMDTLDLLSSHKILLTDQVCSKVLELPNNSLLIVAEDGSPRTKNIFSDSMGNDRFTEMLNGNKSDSSEIDIRMNRGMKLFWMKGKNGQASEWEIEGLQIHEALAFENAYKQHFVSLYKDLLVLGTFFGKEKGLIVGVYDLQGGCCSLISLETINSTETFRLALRRRYLPVDCLLSLGSHCLPFVFQEVTQILISQSFEHFAIIPSNNFNQLCLYSISDSNNSHIQATMEEEKKWNIHRKAYRLVEHIQELKSPKESKNYQEMISKWKESSQSADQLKFRFYDYFVHAFLLYKIMQFLSSTLKVSKLLSNEEQEEIIKFVVNYCEILLNDALPKSFAGNLMAFAASETIKSLFRINDTSKSADKLEYFFGIPQEVMIFSQLFADRLVDNAGIPFDTLESFCTPSCAVKELFSVIFEVSTSSQSKPTETFFKDLQEKLSNELQSFSFEAISRQEMATLPLKFTDMFPTAFQIANVTTTSATVANESVASDYRHAQIVVEVTLQYFRKQKIVTTDSPAATNAKSAIEEEGQTLGGMEERVEKVLEYLRSLRRFPIRPDFLVTSLPPPDDNVTDDASVRLSDSKEVAESNVLIVISEEAECEHKDDLPERNAVRLLPDATTKSDLKVICKEEAFLDYEDIYPQENHTEIISPASAQPTVTFGDDTKASNSCCCVQ